MFKNISNNIYFLQALIRAETAVAKIEKATQTIDTSFVLGTSNQNLSSFTFNATKNNPKEGPFEHFTSKINATVDTADADAIKNR